MPLRGLIFHPRIDLYSRKMPTFLPYYYIGKNPKGKTHPHPKNRASPFDLITTLKNKPPSYRDTLNGVFKLSYDCPYG